jgi:hypothetical protein
MPGSAMITPSERSNAVVACRPRRSRPGQARRSGVLESAFADVSAQIAQSVIDRGWVPEHRIAHYSLHAEIVKEHASGFFAVAEPHIHDPGERILVERGIALGLYAFRVLFRDLAARVLTSQARATGAWERDTHGHDRLPSAARRDHQPRQEANRQRTRPDLSALGTVPAHAELCQLAHGVVGGWPPTGCRRSFVSPRRRSAAGATGSASRSHARGPVSRPRLR